MNTDKIFKILMWLGIGLIAYFFIKLVRGLFQGSSSSTSSRGTTGSASAFSPFSSLWNTVPTVTPASQNNTANLITAGGSAFSNLLTSFGKLFGNSTSSGSSDNASVTISPDNIYTYDWSNPNIIWDNTTGTYLDVEGNTW